MGTTTRVTTTGVTRTLRTAGIDTGRGAPVAVHRGRDDAHVRVTVGGSRDDTYLFEYAADVLRLNGYGVEPGAVPWMLVVTR